MKKLLKIICLLIPICLLSNGYPYFTKNYFIGSGGIKKYESAEIYIQAGHEGRIKGATGTSSPYGVEIEWTPTSCR